MQTPESERHTEREPSQNMTKHKRATIPTARDMNQAITSKQHDESHELMMYAANNHLINKMASTKK